MMRTAVAGLADRLVTLVVPKTTAGACPCNDVSYRYCWCNWFTLRKMYQRCNLGCHCNVLNCSGCEYPMEPC